MMAQLLMRLDCGGYPGRFRWFGVIFNSDGGACTCNSYYLYQYYVRGVGVCTVWSVGVCTGKTPGNHRLLWKTPAQGAERPQGARGRPSRWPAQSGPSGAHPRGGKWVSSPGPRSPTEFSWCHSRFLGDSEKLI